MLCAIREHDITKVMARQVSKADGPFLCPKCQKQLNIRKGQIKAHHFAHKPPVTCAHGRGETEAHRRAKWAIYDALTKREDVTVCELEYSWGEVISDIFCVMRGVRLALEVQVNALTLDQIAHRTKMYHKKGITVLWMPLYRDKLTNKRYAPKAWEKWLHAAYYGRVYYWLSALTVIPVHFGRYDLYKEETQWYADGAEQTAGGYHYPSKRYKTPKPGKRANIARDFRIRKRDSWKRGKFVVPACNILIDKQDKWW